MNHQANTSGERLFMSEDARPERLAACAIIRDGKTHRSYPGEGHYTIRQALGDTFPGTSNLNDTEGFVTDRGRFVDRAEAQHIALAAGQIRSLMQRNLLSSDITW